MIKCLIHFAVKTQQMLRPSPDPMSHTLWSFCWRTVWILSQWDDDEEQMAAVVSLESLASAVIQQIYIDWICLLGRCISQHQLSARNMRISVYLSQELRNRSQEMSKDIHLYNWGCSDTSAQFIMEAMKFISSHVSEYCLIIRTVDFRNFYVFM